jgi:DNA-directed RNA polymerase subunit RPC12/RpoP
MSGRILLRLDKGLGWTKPLYVACCRDCGTQLARHPDQAAATRAARRIRCPTCGVRTARRLPGTTSPATDLALTRGLRGAPVRQGQSPAQRPHPTQGGMPPVPIPRPRSRSVVRLEGAP